MHLKLRHLAVFHAVMEEGSLSKAADRLGLTQPAVSIALTKLEEMLGYSLFTRSKGYFAPKPEAEILNKDAELALLAFEKFSARAQLIGKGSEGLLRIAAIGSAAIHFLPEAISEFSTRHDRVEVQLMVRSSARIAYLVGNGQTDIGIAEAPIAAQSIRAIDMAIPCVFICRKDDPLANEKFITPSHLAERRIISVYEDHALDRDIRMAFINAGVPWYSEIRCYFFAIMRNLVARGAGVAIVDAINGCAALNDDVIYRPFVPRLTYNIAVIHRADAELQAPASDFLDLTIAYLRAYQNYLPDPEAYAFEGCVRPRL